MEIICLLCEDHTEPSMELMHDHMTDEHDLFTKIINGVTECAE